ncbi:MAG: Exodeoxyribonuclease [Saprospiraceae bacterium]|nr:Exodeoxyribonuclease [Saprospiraceae bacterium]
MDKLLRIASLNVNGLRSALGKGFRDWLRTHDFDMVCLQEIKVDASLADASMFSEEGYHTYWNCAEKKGYSGVAILTKFEPVDVVRGFGMEAYDREGRMLMLDFGTFLLCNSYFPSGSSGEERHAFKMQFLEDVYPYFEKLVQQRPELIVVGDYNIVHRDLDIHNPERKDNPSGFRPEERAWLDRWFGNLFSDSFRILHPGQVEFSWWSFRAGSYGKNKGWRIDYHSVGPGLWERVVYFKHHREIRFSDHCPLEGHYKIPWNS